MYLPWLVCECEVPQPFALAQLLVAERCALPAADEPAASSARRLHGRLLLAGPGLPVTGCWSDRDRRGVGRRTADKAAAAIGGCGTGAAEAARLSCISETATALPGRKP